MALINIRHLITVVRFCAIAGIRAADGFDDLIPVEAVLVEFRGKDQVAVPVGARVVDEIRVLVVDDIERQPRDHVLQFLDLGNK